MDKMPEKNIPKKEIEQIVAKPAKKVEQIPDKPEKEDIKQIVTKQIKEVTTQNTSIINNIETLVKKLSESIKSKKPQTNLIDSLKLMSESIKSKKPQADIVNSTKLTSESIKSKKPQADIVDSTKLTSESIKSEKSKVDLIDSIKLMFESIKSKKPKADIVDSTKLTSESIKSKKPENDSIKLLNNTFEKTANISLAMQAAIAGVGKKIGDLKALSKMKFNEFLSGKFQSIFSDEIKKKEQEKKEDQSGAGGKGGIKMPGVATPGEGNKDIKELVDTIVNIVQQFEQIKDKAKVAKAVSKNIAKMDFGKNIITMLKSFEDPAFSGFTKRRTFSAQITKINAEKAKELEILNEKFKNNLTSAEYLNEKQKIIEKYDSLIENASKSPSELAIATIDSLIGIINLMGGLKDISLKSMMRLKIVNRFNLGGEISKLLKDISKKLKGVNTPDFKAGLDSLSGVVSAIDSFSKGFHKTIFQIMKVTSLRPGMWMKLLFSSLNFGLPSNIEKEYKKLNEYGKNQDIYLQLEDPEIKKDPKKVAELRKQLSSGGATMAPGEMFSKVVSSKLAGMTVVMTAMTNIKDQAKKAAKNILLAVPFVKIATKGMAMIAHMLFSLIKSIDKIIDKKINKGGLINKILGRSLSEKDKPKALGQNLTKIDQVIDMINSIGDIEFKNLKNAIFSIALAFKSKFHETFPKIFIGIAIGFKAFKDITLKESIEFKKKIKNIFTGIATEIKELAKVALLTKLAILTLKGFNHMLELIKHMVNRFKLFKTDLTLENGKIFQGIHTIINSLKGIGKTIIELALVAPFIPVAMLGLTFIVGTIMLLTKIGKSHTVQKGIHVTFSIAQGVVGFILKMALAGLLVTMFAPLIIAGLAFVIGVTELFNWLGNRSQQREINQGVRSLVKISLGIAFFALAIILASAAIAASMNKIIIGLGFFMLTVGIFMLIGLRSKHIKKASIAIVIMGIALAVFAVAMFILGKAFPTPMSMVSTLFGLLLILGFVFVFKFVGKNLVDIVKGALGVLAMSIGLAFFGISLGILSAIFAKNKIDIEQMLLMSLSIVGFGLVFALIGLVAGNVIMGSAAVIVMAIGLTVFALSFKVFMKAGFDKLNTSGWKGVWNMAKLIGLFGLEFALIGAPWVFPFVMLGSIGVGAMGKALSSISEGIKKALSVPWNRIPIEKIKSVLTGLGEAFAAVGREGTKGLGIIGSALSLIGIGPNNVKRGISAVLKASEALNSVGKGLAMFDQLTKGLDLRVIKNKQTGQYEPADGSLLQKIAVSLSVVNKVFSDIGKSGNTNKSFVGLIFGSDFKKSDTEVGIKSVLNAGKALASVGQGLLGFDNLTKDLDLRVKKDQSGAYVPAENSLLQKIAVSLSVVNKVFSDIGKSGNTNKSFVGLIFGSDFKKSDTEVGIKSVLNAGKALISVATGLKEFDSLTKEIDLRSKWDETTKMYIPMKDSVLQKISTVLGVVNKVFSDIGKSGNTNKSFVGLIFGSDFKKSDTEVGIKSVLNAGKALKSVGQGLLEFDKFTKVLNFDASQDGDITKGGSPKSIQGKISMVLGIINKVFSEIGKSGNRHTSLMSFIYGDDFSESDVQKGIKSVKGVGQEFSGIAQGLKVWGEIEKQGFDLNKISINVQKVLTMIGSVFAEIGKKDSGGGLFGDGDVTNGIEAVKGVGNEFKGIADGLKGFVDLEKQGIKLNILTKNITGILTAVANVFSGIGSGKIVDYEGKLIAKVDSESISKGIQSVQGLGSELKGVSESLKGFSDLKKSGIDLKTIGDNIKSILLAVGSAFEQIGKSSGTKTITTNPNEMAAMMNSAGAQTQEKKFEYTGTDAIKKGVEAVKGLGTELANIANGLRPFMDLQKEKINIPRLGQNIKDILTVIAKTFEEIGSKSGEPIEVDTAMLTGDTTQKVQEFSGTAAIAKGIKSVEGVGSVLKGIADMLRPFMDMQKSEKGKKPIDIKRIKKNIAEMISLTADIFAALGGDKGAKGRIKTETGIELAKLDIEIIDSVLPTIKKAQEGLQIISDVANLSNSIDPKKWVKIKDILPAMAMMPINIFTEMSKVYEVMKPNQISALVDVVLPKLIDRINLIVSSQNTLANQIKGFKGKSSPLANLGSDMRKFLIDISKPPSDQILDRVSKTVSFIERYSAVTPKFKIFQESFAKHVKDVKFLIDSVNKIQNEQFDRYIKLQEVIKDMVTASTTQVQSNVSAIIEMLGQQVSFLEKAAALEKEFNQNKESQSLNETQEQYLDKLSQKGINQMSQSELLSVIAYNTQITADHLAKGGMKVKVL